MSKARVLIVEDYRDLREQLAILLRHRHFDVTTARDGRDAIEVYGRELAAGRNFDFVVLDYMLPFDFGDVVAVDLAAQARAGGLPVPKMVAWSGSKDELMNLRLQAAGVNPIFLKGGDPNDLPDFLEMKVRHAAAA